MSSKTYSKLFGCNVHDAIRVSPIALKIINTPEFQRMKRIKQLGLCNYVYPSATHTRFEHSIGTYHLASKMIEKIQQQYPTHEYQINELSPVKIPLTNKIAECIKIAALCHDIGHGPFSHIFDDLILDQHDHPNRHHEVRSCLITEILCKRELADELDDIHIGFIKSLIDPKDHHMGALYQIVANKLNGIDVDKFDYLARDTKTLGLRNCFNANRLINEFIIDHHGNIAYPKHCRMDIYDMFHSRYVMHKKVYSHKTVKIIELMLSDLIKKVDHIFGITKSINNMEDFCKLTDETIFNYIDMVINPPSFVHIKMNEDDLALVKDANQIYQNIITRNLYQQVFEVIDHGGEIKKFIEDYIEYLLNKYPHFNRNDFIIANFNVGYVSSDKKDPFDSIYFYNKKENDVTFKLRKNHICGLINDKLREIHWYLVCKNRDIYQMIINEIKVYDAIIKKEVTLNYVNDEELGEFN